MLGNACATHLRYWQRNAFTRNGKQIAGSQNGLLAGIESCK